MESKVARKRPSQLNTQYLIIYNTISAFLWFVIFGRTILLVPLIGFSKVYGGVGIFTKWTQTLALLEVVHSVLGKWLAMEISEILDFLINLDCRRRSLPSTDNSLASLISTTTRLGHCRPISTIHQQKPGILDYAVGLEHH
jgi:hypothetical protein